MSNTGARSWSSLTEEVLRRAGWRGGRSVPTDSWEAILGERGSFVAHDAARRFLSEFGGLVTYGWPADSIATSSAVRFDPLRAQWQHELFTKASEEAGALLYPVGTADEGASFLGIAEEGALHLVRDRVELLGPSTDQALNRLVEAQGARAALWTPGVPAEEQPFWRRLHTMETGPDAGTRWSEEADRVLRAGGWFPGRSVPTETWESVLSQSGEFEIHDAARRFLAEFGAVGVPYRDPWDTMPWMEFSLDPLLAFWDGGSSRTSPSRRMSTCTPSVCATAGTSVWRWRRTARSTPAWTASGCWLPHPTRRCRGSPAGSVRPPPDSL
ncbi:SUKH-3 domain-containing protein [Streptomyces luteogriseus]